MEIDMEKIKDCVKNIRENNLEEELGEYIIDMHFDDNEAPDNLGNYVLHTFESCETEREFKIAYDMYLNLDGIKEV